MASRPTEPQMWTTLTVCLTSFLQTLNVNEQLCQTLVKQKKPRETGKSAGGRLLRKTAAGPLNGSPSHSLSSKTRLDAFMHKLISLRYGTESVSTYTPPQKKEKKPKNSIFLCILKSLHKTMSMHMLLCVCVCMCVCIAVASNTLQMVKCICGEERKRANVSQLENTLMRNTDATGPQWHKQRTADNITVMSCRRENNGQKE